MPNLGRWIVDPTIREQVVITVRERVEQAGPTGVDLAAFDERERAVLDELPGVAVSDGRVRMAAAADPLADHPAVAALAAGGFRPDAPAGISAPDLRALQRRGVLVERDGVWFHETSIAQAAVLAAQLLAASPEGFTVADFREAADTTRKYALPLANELDARGITRRRGDQRVAGPRLPTL